MIAADQLAEDDGRGDAHHDAAARDQHGAAGVGHAERPEDVADGGAHGVELARQGAHRGREERHQEEHAEPLGMALFT